MMRGLEIFYSLCSVNNDNDTLFTNVVCKDIFLLFTVQEWFISSPNYGFSRDFIALRLPRIQNLDFRPITTRPQSNEGSDFSFIIFLSLSFLCNRSC